MQYQKHCTCRALTCNHGIVQKQQYDKYSALSYITRVKARVDWSTVSEIKQYYDCEMIMFILGKDITHPHI